MSSLSFTLLSVGVIILLIFNLQFLLLLKKAFEIALAVDRIQVKVCQHADRERVSVKALNQIVSCEDVGPHPRIIFEAFEAAHLSDLLLSLVWRDFGPIKVVWVAGYKVVNLFCLELLKPFFV